MYIDATFVQAKHIESIKNKGKPNGSKQTNE